ncbi:MAG: NAD(P)H-dependent oxidoreductase [Verrucomicrobiota bacterium]
MKTAFLGSSNPHGNTRYFAEVCCRVCNAEIVDISTYDFTPWDYDGKNLNDEFQHLAKLMLEYSDIIFCTPVYWYSMSCQMKIFFDRFSDLLTRRKRIGKALAGKRTWLIAVGNEAVIPEGFEVPFKRTSDYMKMHYMGAVFGDSTNDEFSPVDIKKAESFGHRIKMA